MKKTALYGVLIGIGIIIGASASFFLRPPFGGPKRWEHKLNLSDEERQQVRDLFREDKEEFKGLVREMESVGEELRTDLKNPEATEDQLKEKFNKFHDIRQKLTDQRFEMNLKIRKMIGPERMETLDVLGPMPFERPHKRGGPHPPRREKKEEGS